MTTLYLHDLYWRNVQKLQKFDYYFKHELYDKIIEMNFLYT